jgi:hypothetical protein
MNKEFIPYEQSLELKELGFDETCLAYYELGNFNLKPIPMKDEISSFHSNRNALMIASPLYQQAFRWFRDVHGLNGVVEGSKKHGFEWCIFPDLDYYMKPPNNFNTYEESEMACLRRLIEVVKEKK